MNAKNIEKIKRLINTGFFHIFGSSVINKIVGFLSSVVLIRLLSKTEYGTFTYSWNIYSILLLANGFGMESGVLQLCSEKGNDKKNITKILNAGTRIGIKFDIILCAIILSIGCFANLKFSNAGILLRLLCILPMLQFLYALSTVVLRAEKRNKEYAWLTIINTIMIFVCTATGAFLFKETGMIIGYYIAYGTSVFIAIFFMNIRFVKRNNEIAQNEKKSLLSISFVSMCNNGLSQLMYLLDVFVLGIVAADQDILASYKVATIIPTALSFVPIAIVTYIYPYFAEKREDGAWCIAKYKQVLLGTGLLNGSISFMLVILAPYIIILVYGSNYLDAVSVFRILAINYFFSGTFRVISGNLLVTQRKLKFNLWVALISGVVNIFADYYFIQWWGSNGAAYATVLVVLVSSIMSTTYLIWTLKRKKINADRRRKGDLVE